MDVMMEARRPLPGCTGCSAGPGFDFTMAFQPILDLEAGAVFAYEALVRGTGGEGAGHVLSRVNATNRYAFDQACRVRAIGLAARLGISSALSINFMPNAVYRPEHCIRTTLEAARSCGFPVGRIIFEVTEGERVEDPAHLVGILEHYKRQGFLTAIDDFGAGYAGLSLLAEFRPDLVKLDMGLLRGIDRDRGRRAIVRGVVQVCTDLGVTPVAEGVETPGELGALRDLGLRLFQGYLIARPAFEALPAVSPGLFGTTRGAAAPMTPSQLTDRG